MSDLKFSEIANYQPKQKVAEETLFDPECKYLLYGGAVGGGKSYWLRWTALELALYYYHKYGIKGGTIGLFSEDYPTLKDRQISKIRMEFPESLGTLKSTQTGGLGFYINEDLGGWVILLRNLDDPSKYASSEFAAIGVEELTKTPRETFDALRHRLRFPGIKDTKFFAATNPGGVGHAYVKQLWVDRDSTDPEQDSFFYVPASYRDNEYIDTESYEKQLSGLPEELRKALMEGDWNLVAGQAFNELTERKHIIDPITLPDDTRYFAGYDHGFNHPYSFILFAVTPDGGVYVIKHLTGRLKRPDEIVKEIKALCGGITNKGKVIQIFAGTDIWTRQRDGGPSVSEQFTKEGLTKGMGYILIKAKTDRIQGVAEIRKWLAWKGTESEEPALKFFRNTKRVYETLSYMQFDENHPEDVMKMDADLNGIGGDDDYDAFRYGIMSRARPPRIDKPEYAEGSGMKLIKEHIEEKQMKRTMGRWY